MKQILKWSGIALVGALVVMQFFRPDMSNPESEPTRSIWSDSAVPSAVRQILTRSCIDCHSYQTDWPWYSHVAPVSWLVAGDVRDGRKHVNLSLWMEYPQRRKMKIMREIVEETTGGEMPLGIYTLMHPSARLSPDDLKALKSWSTRAGPEGSEAEKENTSE